MVSTVPPTRRIALATLTLLALLPSVAGAQPVVTDPYKIVIPRVSSAYWGYTDNPYASYLHGAADVIRSQGEFTFMRQEAVLRRQKVREAKLENRRKELEQWDWERAFWTKSVEEQRQRVREAQIERSRNDPPLTEIWSAMALNDLLGELKRSRGELSAGASVPVEPEWLEHVHVTSGKGRGNVGLLKRGRVPWPLLLGSPQFDGERKAIDRLMKDVCEEARRGHRIDESLRQLQGQVAALQKKLRAANKNTEPNAWIHVQSFLRDLDAALAGLERPDAAFYLLPVQGKTVAEVVEYMTRKGVDFAPATCGDERHYRALYSALAAEVNRVRATMKARDE